MEAQDVCVSVSVCICTCTPRNCSNVTLWRSQAGSVSPMALCSLYPPIKSDPLSFPRPDLACEAGVQGWRPGRSELQELSAGASGRLRGRPLGVSSSKGCSSLGEDLVHVSGSQLLSPALAMQKTRQVPGLSPGVARRRKDRRPHPPCGQAPPRLPPKKRKGQEGPAPAWPLPPLQADSHAPTPEFSM